MIPSIKHWIASAYFIGFEVFFWAKGIDMVYALKYFFELGRPFIAGVEEQGVFHSISEPIVSLVFIFASLFCLAKFIESISYIIKQEVA